MLARLMTIFLGIITGAILVGTSVLVATHVMAQEPNAPVAVSQVLSYQGRLLDPATGAPQPDSVYQITFSLYNVEASGTALWTEEKSITTSDGFFATLLGDITPLILSDFDGQELFLGIKVNEDPEAIPRQRLAHSAYAMFAEDAGTLDGIDSTGLAAASHTHNGSAIDAGTVAEARIDGALARDSEVMGIVLGADGAGSTLDADLLDGKTSSAFATNNHSHSTLAIAFGHIDDDGDQLGGTNNINSVWDGANERYRITLDRDYVHTKHITIVTLASTTGACANATTFAQGIGNDLIIHVLADDTNKTPKQCPFQFVTFGP